MLYLLHERKYEEATAAAATMVNDMNLTEQDALGKHDLDHISNSKHFTELLPLHATLCMLSGRTISAEKALERFFTLYNNLDESRQKMAQQVCSYYSNDIFIRVRALLTS